jgi:phage tail-like protein
MNEYYPPVSFYFNVVIDNNTNQDTSFQEVSGITAEIRTEEINEGGENRFVYKVPKSVQYPNLILKRGIATENSPLIQWCIQSIQSGSFDITPKLLKVILLDEEGSPLVTWQFEKAYPIKYQVSGFNAERSELVIESIELAYTRFEKVS